MNNNPDLPELPEPQFHTEVAGDGAPAILFIHGYGGNTAHWKLQIEALSGHTRCISFDLRGHGKNRGYLTGYSIEAAARDALAVLRSVIGNARVIVVGHSMGTRVALQLERMEPARVAGLILIDGSCVPGNPQAVTDWVQREIGRQGYASFAQETLNGYLIDTLAEEKQAALLASALLLDQEAAISYWASMAQWDAQDFDPAVAGTGPVITVLQSTSFSEPPDCQRFYITDLATSRWLETWSQHAHAKIIRVADAGHYTMLEQPEIVNDAIREVLLATRAAGARTGYGA